jgi:tetratricopeptide (TPR) repeat protein
MIRRRGIIVLLLTVLTAVSAAPIAYASDDGGLRSVFALGAGNRAIALGGAYAALADDASAALWNPAGLAQLERRRIEFTSTNLIGMGFSEKYLSLAYPHWRLGNTSLILRTFGVDGIESRDDRNVLLADDLKDQELELLLSHARTLRPGLSVGGGLKLQRQSLAGYSGGGFGIDAGVLVHPLAMRGDNTSAGRTWAIGLALRNIIEPAIRLDAESVPDPRALRLGTAYRRPLGTQLKGLIALDLEKTAGMDTRLHIGTETTYRDQASLRLGLLAGSLTAGFGLRWRDLVVDFAFEDHALGSVKRIGVSFLQGDAVGETRNNALAKAEADRRRQLELAFAESEKARREQLLSGARDAYQRGNHADALDRLSMLMLLDPDSEGAAGMEVEVLRDLAGKQEAAGDMASAVITLGRLSAKAPDNAELQAELKRLRTASAASAQRSLSIQDLYARGLDAFVAEELDLAQRLFTEARDLAPEDTDIQAMLGRIQRMRTQRLAVACSEARSLIGAGQVDEADAAIGRAAAMGAPADSLSSLRAAVGDRRRQLAYAAERRQHEQDMADQLAALDDQPAQRTETAADAGTSRPALSASRRAELAALSARALELFEAGDADEAVRIWEMVWSEDPGDREVVDALREEYLTRGMAAYASGDLSGAVMVWEQALRVAPDDPRTKGYLKRARQQQARIRALQSDDQSGVGGVR